jgi:hypothetical protein
MRCLAAVTILWFFAASPVQAEEVKQATFGNPAERGMQYGLKQYRHVFLKTISTGHTLAKVVVPAENNVGQFTCSEFSSPEGERILVRRAVVSIGHGRSLMKVDTLQKLKSGNSANSQEVMIDDKGTQTPIINAAQLDSKIHNALSSVRLIFDTGDTAIRHDQPLAVQVSNQLKAKGENPGLPASR